MTSFRKVCYLVIQLATELENDENTNDANTAANQEARDVKYTIKSNDANNEMNVRTGMANYKCKV